MILVISEKIMDTMQTNQIFINNLNKSYKHADQEIILFNDFNISFEINKINCIIGKSGCGKSTLLRFIAGIENADSGGISLQKNVANKLLFYMIFQDKNLFPWLTVFQNIELRFVNKKIHKKRRKEIIYSELEKYNLLDAVDKYSYQLSGGMIQKISLICSMIYEPDVVLMDEPLASLDQISKKQALQFLRQEKVKHEMTVIYVTHDLHEALSIADNIYILKYNKESKHSLRCIRNYCLNQFDSNDYMKLIREIEDYLE